MIKQLLRLLVIVLLSASCNSDHRHRVKGGKLTVYFVEKEDKGLAMNLANFWKEKSLLTGRDQDIELKRVADGYAVSIIAVDPQKVKEIPFAEQKALTALRSALQKAVFRDDLLVLYLCDGKFNRLLTIG